MGTINQINFRKKMQTELQAQKFVAFAYNAANTRFIAAKQNMLEELMESPVTKEINEASLDQPFQVIAQEGGESYNLPAGTRLEITNQELYLESKIHET